MQNKLKAVFSEQIQVKRVKKEIDAIINNEEFKKSAEVRFSFIRDQQLNIHVTLRERFFSKLPIDKRPSSEVQIKISYTKSYPYDKPRVFFVSDNNNSLHTLGCRDYINELCNHNWSTKVQLTQLIGSILPFYMKLLQLKPINSMGSYNRGDFIELQSLYSQKSLEIYPIVIQISQKSESAFLVINRVDMIFLENTLLENFVRLVEVYPLASVKAIFTSKKIPKQLLLQIKWGKMEGGFEFRSQDHQNITNSIVTKKSTYQDEYHSLEYKLQEKTKTQSVPEISKSLKRSSSNYLDQLNESIMVIQSLLEKQYDQSQLNNLIGLYKRAVEYCSANNVSNYKFYLDKLQELLSRDETFVLINSTSLAEKNNARSSPSVFDWFDDKSL